MQGWIEKGGARLQAALLLGLCLAAGFYSASLGTDANWDLRNYHYYSGFAFLNGRLGFDVAPGQVQTYLNPLGNLPYYLLAHGWPQHPWWIAFAMGLPTGVYVFALAKIALLMARPVFLAPRVGKLAAWIATLLGSTGAAFYPLIGGSFNDIAYGALTMLAIWLVLRAAAAPEQDARRSWLPMLLAGLLCGAAAGLKLVNLLYAMPLGVAVLLLLGLRPALFVGAGMAAGFLAAWGPFALMLQHEFGSPFFPFYNQIFRSPDFLPIGTADERFLPRSLLQAIFYPFYWLEPSTLSIEAPMRDGRVALGYAATLLLIGMAFRRGFGREAARREGPLLLLLLVTVGSYLLWARMFGIYRYLLILESLSGVLVMVAIGRLVPRPRLLAVALFAAVAAGTIYTTIRPDWGHVAHGTRVIRLEPAPPVASGAMVLVVGGYPVSYLVPFLPADVRVVALTNNVMYPQFAQAGRDYGLLRRAREAVAGHRGAFWMLTDPAESQAAIEAVLTPFGLRAGACQTIRSNMEPAGHRFCEVSRVGG